MSMYRTTSLVCPAVNYKSYRIRALYSNKELKQYYNSEATASKIMILVSQWERTISMLGDL